MQNERKETLPLLQLLPNFVTIIGLCAGLTAIRFIIVGRFEVAATLIFFAAAIDGLDGLLARKLNATSAIGAELDSLSDFLNFGVAPALMVYQAALTESYTTNWMFVLMYVICACLRLARFNVNRNKPTIGAKPHFIGVPAPGGAALAMFPMILSFENMNWLTEYFYAYGIYLGFIGLLMASSVPTLSSKSIRVPKDRAIFVLVGGALFAGLAITQLWKLVLIVTAAYMLVIAFNCLTYLAKLVRRPKP